MAYQTNITAGAPPLLWSNLDQAFKQVNQNFTELQLYINESGITPIDLTNLSTDLSPSESNVYKLGAQSASWKRLHLSPYLETDQDVLNGLWLGSAQIKGIGYTVDLPENSTIGGQSIIDPERTYYKTISVNGVAVEAKSQDSTLTFVPGPGITLVGNPAIESINISNSGVRSLTNTTVIPSGRTAGTGISVSQSNGDIAITNTGVVAVDGGAGVIVSTDTTTGIATVNIAFGTPLVFRTIQVPGHDPLVADSISDTLNIQPGKGILISTSEISDNDTLTISLDNNIDINGSVFADDSSILVDAVNGKIVGPIETDVVAIKIYGGSIGQTLFTDDEGNLSFDSPSNTRTVVSETTDILPDGDSEDLEIEGYKGYVLYKIETSDAAWVRIYTDTTSRTADATRLESEDPLPGSGVIAEVITTGDETIIVTPATVGFSAEEIPSADIPISVTNKSGGSTAITITLTILQIER